MPTLPTIQQIVDIVSPVATPFMTALLPWFYMFLGVYVGAILLRGLINWISGAFVSLANMLGNGGNSVRKEDRARGYSIRPGYTSDWDRKSRRWIPSQPDFGSVNYYEEQDYPAQFLN